MPEARKLDRRIQRTRALLRDALMTLILKKRYDEITIQDITDEANVARTTFYLHFETKDDLLFSTMRDMYEELYEASRHDVTEGFFSQAEEDCHAQDFEHVEQFAEFYRIMLSERGSAAFLARVRQYLAESIMAENLADYIPENSTAKIPVEVMAYAIAGAQIGVIKWWLDKDMPYPARKMAFMLEQLLKRGLIWGLNIQDEESLISK